MSAMPDERRANWAAWRSEAEAECPPGFFLCGYIDEYTSVPYGVEGREWDGYDNDQDCREGRERYTPIYQPNREPRPEVTVEQGGANDVGLASYSVYMGTRHGKAMVARFYFAPGIRVDRLDEWDARRRAEALAANLR